MDVRKLHVARARESDIPELVELLSVLFAQEVEFTADAQAQRRGLSMIISNPHLGAVLVARGGGSLLGMVNLLFTVSTALGARVALLEDMVVAPTARGSGVGSLLLTHAVSFARSENCMRITLLTDSVNRSAQRFYVKHGFRRSSMIPLRMPLASCCAIAPVSGSGGGGIDAAQAPEGERVEQVDPEDGA